MAYARLTTQQAVDWLRQKTRTASTPADQTGEWSDQDILDALNASVREVVTRMLTTPWAAYFLATEAATTVAGLVVVGLASSQEYAAIKVAFVQYGVGDADVDEFLPQMSVNRMVATANTQNTEGATAIGDKVFYIVRSTGHETGDPKIALQLFNNGSTQHALKITYYCYPKFLTAVSGTDYIGLPPIIWNAMLSYALAVMCEDERNGELRMYAQQRFDGELQTAILAAPTSYDFPDNLHGPADRPSL